MEKIKYKRTLILAAVMLCGFFLLKYTASSENIVLKKSFSYFPKKINQWQGEKKFFDKKVYDVLGVDDSLLMDYKSPDNEFVQLYIGYYQSQKEGDLIHSPKNCMPGSGWNIVDSGIEKVDIGEKTIKVIRLNLKKGSSEQTVLYWFHSRGRIISSEYFQKIWLVIDSLTKRRTDGSFVRLITPVKENREKSLELLKDFTAEIFPYINEYIPS